MENHSGSDCVDLLESPSLSVPLETTAFNKPDNSFSNSCCIYWSLLYSAILRSWADSLCLHVILHEWIAFYSAFLNIHRSGVLTALAWLVPQESAARESQSRHVLCTPYNHAPFHFMQSHIRKVYACLAVTCHLRFWQNDWGLLRATAVTRGWNGYRNKSQHRKLTPEKKILPPLQQGFETTTFRSRVRCSNHWAIPALPVVQPVVLLKIICIDLWLLTGLDIWAVTLVSKTDKEYFRVVTHCVIT